MGEENEDDDFDDCRVSADCLVYGSVRSRFRAAKQSPPSRTRQRAVPRHQRLCGAGGVGWVGLQLRWWSVGTGRALIFSLVRFSGYSKGKGRSQVTGSFLFLLTGSRCPGVRQSAIKWLLSGHDCCSSATVPEDLTFIQASLGPRRFLATPLHEIISP
jgi:hypothetical protein